MTGQWGKLAAVFLHYLTVTSSLMLPVLPWEAGEPNLTCLSATVVSNISSQASPHLKLILLLKPCQQAAKKGDQRDVSVGQ